MRVQSGVGESRLECTATAHQPRLRRALHQARPPDRNCPRRLGQREGAAGIGGRAEEPLLHPRAADRLRPPDVRDGSGHDGHYLPDGRRDRGAEQCLLHPLPRPLPRVLLLHLLRRRPLRVEAVRHRLPGDPRRDPQPQLPLGRARVLQRDDAGLLFLRALRAHCPRHNAPFHAPPPCTLP